MAAEASASARQLMRRSLTWTAARSGSRLEAASAVGRSLLLHTCSHVAAPARPATAAPAVGWERWSGEPVRFIAAAAAKRRRQEAREKSRSPLDVRRQRRSSADEAVIRVAGVTFEGRQEALLAVEAGCAVAVVKEPDNAFDPHAVRIETLGGRSLGYVPREDTARFPHHCVFGRVQSVGPSQAGQLGARVSVWPELPALTVDLFPSSLKRSADLRDHLPPEAYTALAAEACERAGWRCEVSGAAGSAVTEVWSWDPAAYAIRLAGVQCVHPDVWKVRHLSTLEAGEAVRATELLGSINGWSRNETHLYQETLAFRCLQAGTDSQNWQLDLSWLEGRTK